MKRFLVIERFRNRDPRPVYDRFRERGRLAPEGLIYEASWVSVELDTCYQVMATDDSLLLDGWVARWSDLIDSQIIPVMESADAAARVAALPT